MTDARKLADGFYWVRIFAGRTWHAAEYDGKYFWLIHKFQMYSPHELAEIDPTPIIMETKK